MRYLALAIDYDGTLALNGRVHESTIRSLEKLLTTNRKLILVTGRELDDLLNVFPHPHLFEWIVAENGLLLYKPSSKETILLANRHLKNSFSICAPEAFPSLSVGISSRPSGRTKRLC